MKDFIKNIIPDLVIKEYSKYKKLKKIQPFKGDNVICPICESRFRIFAPYGGSVIRENALCLKCDSFERHRLLWKYLIEKTDLFNGAKKTLLHFAPEKCLYDIFSKNQDFEYVPCDIFPEYYNYSGKIKIEKIDMINIPYSTDYFDIILNNQVLEHIPDDKSAMAELYRVMKKGGWGIFQVPIDFNKYETYEDFSITTSEGRKKAFGQHDHVRVYGLDYKDRLESAGFEVIVDDFIKNFSQQDLFKYGLIDSELIYYCRKK